MNPERLTVKSAEAVNDAVAMARRAGNPLVYDTHLLLALLGQQESIVVPVLQKVGASVAQLREQAEREAARYPKQSGGGSGQPSMARELNQVLDRAEEEARSLGDEYVSTEHLLLALAATKGGEANTILSRAGASHATLLAAIESVRGSHRVTDQTPENQYQALEKYTRDLTEAARRQPASCSSPAPGTTQSSRR